jgi:DNA-binding transcriptional LysR family regulator
MNVELRHLRTFIVLAEELHFGRAADRLRITQPSLTQQIQRLETLVGAQLFFRSTRRVELTHSGRDLLRRSRDILALVNEAFEQVIGQGPSRSLSLGLCGTTGYDLLPRIVASARSRLPEVALTARGEMHSSEAYDELLGGGLDLALVFGPVTNPEVAAKTLRREALGVLMPADHKLAEHTEILIADIAHERLVVCEESLSDEMHKHVAKLCLDAGFRATLRPVGHLLSAQAGFIAAGLGVAVLPVSASYLGFAGTCFVPLREAEPVEVAMIWRRNCSEGDLSQLLTLVFEAAHAA